MTDAGAQETRILVQHDLPLGVIRAAWFHLLFQRPEKTPTEIESIASEIPWLALPAWVTWVTCDPDGTWRGFSGNQDEQPLYDRCGPQQPRWKQGAMCATRAFLHVEEARLNKNKFPLTRAAIAHLLCFCRPASHISQPGPPVHHLTFSELRAANIKRCPAFGRGPVEAWPLQNWALALSGEAGELANAVKKQLRGDHNAPDIGDIMDEVADVVIYADLLAASQGCTLADAIQRKFNKTSDKIHSDVKL